MQETLEQILDYLKGIWIKRRFIIISTWLICPLSWLVISQLDDEYQSEARIFADTQSILGPLLKGITVETNTDHQVNLMITTLLSRPNLERIARMTDLDIQAETPIEFEKLIKRLKEDIIIRKTGGYKDNLFNVSFEDKDPQMAKNVVQAVLNVFIENTLGSNRIDTDEAHKFLDSQINEFESRLLADEARLTDFKQKYADILPNDAGDYYSQLQSEKSELETAKLQLREIETSITSANQQLAENSKNPSTASDKITGVNTVSTAYDERIQQLESKLDDLLIRYTENHPDVVEAKRLLDNLNVTRKKELESYYKTLSETRNGDSSNLNALNINPVYQEIKIQVNKLENEAASLNVRVKNYQTKVKDLENKIHIIPEIEAELVALNRGYNITKAKYEDLLNRRETSNIAKQADKTTNKINFKIIDPARAPVKPTGPKRILLLLASTIFGGGVGIGLSLLFSQINPVVTSGNQIFKATGIPVFGAISATENLGLQQWHKKKTILFIVSNTLLLGLLFCFMLYSIFPEAVKAPFKGMF